MLHLICFCHECANNIFILEGDQNTENQNTEIQNTEIKIPKIKTPKIKIPKFFNLIKTYFGTSYLYKN